MIWMAASDLHGSAESTEKLLNRFEEEGAERLLLCGDYSSHSYLADCTESGLTVAEMLNEYADRIYGVCGNCDYEEDQADYDFEMRVPLQKLSFGNRHIYMTHGHLYDAMYPPKPMEKGAYLLCGHTHVPSYEDYRDYIYINPGSAARPRGGSPKSYLLMTEQKLIWKDLTGKAFMEMPW